MTISVERGSLDDTVWETTAITLEADDEWRVADPREDYYFGAVECRHEATTAQIQFINREHAEGLYRLLGQLLHFREAPSDG